MKKKFLLAKILIQYFIFTFIIYGIVFSPMIFFLKVDIELYLHIIAFIIGSFMPKAYREFKEVV